MEPNQDYKVKPNDFPSEFLQSGPCLMRGMTRNTAIVEKGFLGELSQDFSGKALTNSLNTLS